MKATLTREVLAVSEGSTWSARAATSSPARNVGAGSRQNKNLQVSDHLGEVGLAGVRPYGLRASNISWMHAGVPDLPTIRARAGHVRSATTRLR